MSAADLAPDFWTTVGSIALNVVIVVPVIRAMRRTSDYSLNASTSWERGRAIGLLLLTSPLWAVTWFLLLTFRRDDGPDVLPGTNLARRGVFYVTEGVGVTGDHERLAIFGAWDLEDRRTRRARLLNYLLDRTPAERLPMLFSVVAGDASLATATEQNRRLKQQRQEGLRAHRERQQRRQVAGATRCTSARVTPQRRRGRANRLACNARRQGSRRIASRSAGGGGGDPPDGGDPEPGEKPRHRLNAVVVAVLLALLAPSTAGAQMIDGTVDLAAYAHHEFADILNTPDEAGDGWRAFHDFNARFGEATGTELMWELARSEVCEEHDDLLAFQLQPWRLGDVEETLLADLRDPAMQAPATCDDTLHRLRRIALMDHFQQASDHPERGFWLYGLNLELSIVSQMTGVDFVVEIAEGSPLLTEDQFWVWATEIESESRGATALTFQWKALLAEREGRAEEAAAMEREAADYRRQQAEWRRKAATERRELQRRPSRLSFFRLLRPRSRCHRSAPLRTRGSRRTTSRSAGGGGSGDPPDSDSPEPALGRLFIAAEVSR